MSNGKDGVALVARGNTMIISERNNEIVNLTYNFDTDIQRIMQSSTFQLN